MTTGPTHEPLTTEPAASSTVQYSLVTQLADFEVRSPADLAKVDDELVHTTCGEVLCDVEHGDSMSTLVDMALDHTCPGTPAPATPTAEPEAAPEPVSEPQRWDVQITVRDGHDLRRHLTPAMLALVEELTTHGIPAEATAFGPTGDAYDSWDSYGD